MMNNTQRITVLDNEFVTVWVYPERRMVHHQFHRFLYGQAFRDALNAGADALKQYGAIKWLSDDRQNSAMPTADMEWARTDWYPRVEAAGWKYWAVVQPLSVLGKMNMEREVEINAAKGVVTRMFSNPEEAMAWLEKQ